MYFRDVDNEWINAWAARHAREHPGDPFPRDASDFWGKLEVWISNFSYWAVRSTHRALDPVELAEKIGDRVLAFSNTYDGRAAFTTWLCTVGRRTMLSMIKVKQHTDTSYLDDELQGRGQDILLATHASLYGYYPEAMLEELLERLPNRAAEMLRLRRIEGWTDYEIAARFNTTPEAVHQVIARAVRQLRSMVNDGSMLPKRQQESPSRVRVTRAATQSR